MAEWMILLLGALLVLTHRTADGGLTGYDCGQAPRNLTIISSKRVKPCALADVGPEVETVQFQLLQKIDSRRITVRGCRIRETLHITRCGMFSHIEEVNQGYTTNIRGVSRELCRDMTVYGKFRYVDTLVDLAGVNMTTYRTITVVGSLTDDGSCDGGHFTRDGHEYKKVVVVAKLEISVYTYEGHLDLLRDTVTVAGTTCPYNNGRCSTTEGMSLYWSIEQFSPCEFDRYVILYEGPGAKLTDNSTAKIRTLYFTNNTGNIQFGLAREEKLNLCGYQIFASEHSSLFLTEVAPGHGFTKNYGLDAENVLQEAYFNTKITYLARHVRIQFGRLYQDILFNRCNTQRQIYSVALKQAGQQPDLFAMDIRGEGHMSYQAGESIYLFACKAIDCKLRETDRCYNEIPVTCESQNLFLKPLSRVMTRVGTPAECSQIFPALFDIAGAWRKVGPVYTVARTPQEFDPNVQATWKYEDLEKPTNIGIYSVRELEKLRKYVTFQAEHQAYMTMLGKKMADRDFLIDEDKLGNLINPENIQGFMESFRRKLIDGFTEFGLFCAAVLGIGVIVQFVLYIFDIFVRGYTLYEIFGWSRKLFGAIFGSVTHRLTTRQYNRAYNPNVEEGNSAALRLQRRSNTEEQRSAPVAQIRRHRSIEELERDLLDDSGNANHRANSSE